tara:strand:- start:203 stop:673 length:471 start_codon:yes stop_codon:yes gene_type:complete
MKKHLWLMILFYTTLSSQSNTSIEAVRKIRLDNLKNNYLNKTIRFYIPGKISVIGELRDITNNNFIISGKNGPSSYNHKDINYVFIDPTLKDLIMVFAISTISGISSYMALLIIKNKPDAAMKGVTISISSVLAGIIARSTFYKPIKIDISGETNI